MYRYLRTLADAGACACGRVSECQSAASVLEGLQCLGPSSSRAALVVVMCGKLSVLRERYSKAVCQDTYLALAALIQAG